MPGLGTVAKPFLLRFRNTWSHQIRAIYTQKFNGRCPRSLSQLQTLTFLPKILGVNVPWPILDTQTVASRCGIHHDCFFHDASLLVSALASSPEFNALCAEVLEYRLEKKQDCCTALRQIVTWNVSGWRTLQWTNPKTKAILRHARKGIVCLQETKWSQSTSTSFLQSYPGFNIAHTPALITDNGGLSGGVAISIPCMFRLPREVIIMPGKVIAALVQTRADQFWVISAYHHPNTARTDCETMKAWLSGHADETDPFFILGDFNHSDTLSPDTWQCLLEAAQGENIIHEPTLWGPNGASSLDKAILPTEYLNRGLLQYQTLYDRYFESSGHACISIRLRHRPPVSSSPELPTHMTIPADSSLAKIALTLDQYGRRSSP